MEYTQLPTTRTEVTLLIGHDLSAAFDTVDHEILLERLQTEFGVEGVPLTLTWLRFYLDGRTQRVVSKTYLRDKLYQKL